MRILRKQELLKIIGLSASSIGRLERAGDFPQRVRLGPSAVGWREDEINDWIEALKRRGADDAARSNAKVSDQNETGELQP